ncbi:hypothetical protein MmiEs2_06060 [Methanimicrococcus stummii]|uniref:TiaS-like TCKD domain-containing protein n=1 Tax=Methanimicrococcus stummii TaxID=3028294 RepID=A0AA96V9L7_9EURY|nr:methanogenesis marker protein 11 [Methanimicrococcus sp. Es2]WNY28421.1 hypothetical protein MmiEs2_06060 [Methanimicrococcus sp. Es2]
MEDPYTVPYKGIYAICDENGSKAEIIEHSNCYGGACWSLHHYAKSPAVTNAKAVGECIRYSVKTGPSTLELKSSVAAAGIESVICDDSKNEVQITYMGIGGGGIGATKCRAFANGVLRFEISESGGGKTATGKIFVPKRKRVLIAIDDTDSCDEGATWTLTHNIAKAVSCEDSVYLSQALVQLYPVPEKTQNCMSTVLEFGCVSDAAKEKLVAGIKELLLKYSVSENTGMLVYTAFDVTEDLKEYSHLGRTMRVSREKTLETAKTNNVEIVLDGNGIIGAMAAFAWFAQPIEAVKPEFDVNSI